MTVRARCLREWQALADATARIGPPVDLSQFGVQVPQWLPTSALNAIVAHETAAERRDTRQLLADHLRLEGKLETYKRQVRALTRDIALARRDGGSGSGNGTAAQSSAARARSNSGAGLRSRVKHLQDLLEVRRPRRSPAQPRSAHTLTAMAPAISPLRKRMASFGRCAKL